MNIPAKYRDAAVQLKAAKADITLLKNAYNAANSHASDLQQRLTVAEQRAGELESAAREMLRIAGIANQGSNAYNRAIINLNAALKPAEEGK